MFTGNLASGHIFSAAAFETLAIGPALNAILIAIVGKCN